jgi:hypothetical protein
MNNHQIGAESLIDRLKQFTGTEKYYRHWLNQFVYTDGVKYLADTTESYWLLDAIASYQPSLITDRMLSEFQIWKLAVKPDQSAILSCERDTDDLVLQQSIEFTDFPALPEIKLFLESGVLLLPSEH